MKSRRSSLYTCAIVVAGVGYASRSRANTAIDIEAVDAYSCGALSQNIANVDNFRNRMMAIGGYTNGVRYTNGLVYPTDFIDPERSGGTGGADSYNFDRSGAAISFFSGHGSCNDQTNTSCTSAANCPALAGLQAVCLRHTENPLTGRCSYSRGRSIIVDKTGTSCSAVNYSTGPVAFGESAAFPWAGTGTNGGVNFSVLDVSCGLTPSFDFQNTQNLWAGVSTIATIVPTRSGSDTADVSDRGRAFADRYVANPNSAVAVMWADAINSISGGSSCAFGGGNHGIVGCGANISISVEVTLDRALWANRTESWIQLRDEANDGIGTGWRASIWTCNYDCNAHPFVL